VRRRELDARPPEVDAGIDAGDPGRGVDGDVGCWDAELEGLLLAGLFCSVHGSGSRNDEEEEAVGDMVAKHTSLLPLPKPLTTSPFMRSGKGGSGPDSGPTMLSRCRLGETVSAIVCNLLFSPCSKLRL
jgi:hypothetical protein